MCSALLRLSFKDAMSGLIVFVFAVCKVLSGEPPDICNYISLLKDTIPVLTFQLNPTIILIKYRRHVAKRNDETAAKILTTE